MLKSKIFEVLKTFSKEDHKKFRQFISSEYFNSSIMIRKLYRSILKNIDEMNNEKLTYEKLFEELYPGKKYREGTVLTLLSRLYKLSEDYIAQQAYEAESSGNRKYLLKGLKRRRLDKFVLKCYNDSVNKMETALIRDLDYFQMRHEIEYQYVSFLTNNDKGFNIESAHIQNYCDRFIEHFTIRILSVYIFMLNQTLFVHENNFRMPYLDYLIEYLEMNSFERVPSISLYFNLLMLTKEYDEKYFFRLKEIISAHPYIIEGEERNNIYISMINYCVFKSRVSGINRFSGEAFELLKYVAENKTYITEYSTNIDHLLYLNTVMTGLNVKEFEWIENYIKQNKEELVPERRENAYNLSYALFHFSKKNYKKSMEYLNKVQRVNTFFNLQINTLMLQNYYELNLFENAFSFIDSYKHYLRENSEIQTFNKTRTKDFLDIVNKLLKIKCGKIKFESSEFDLSPEELTNILKRNWVTEKINEVKKTFEMV